MPMLCAAQILIRLKLPGVCRGCFELTFKLLHWNRVDLRRDCTCRSGGKRRQFAPIHSRRHILVAYGFQINHR